MAKLNNVLLRSKFPEFIKVNIALSMALLALMSTQIAISGFPVSTATLSIVLLGIALAIVKLIDLLLSATKGLAIAVIGFAVFMPARR